jgi:hypothetical protein
MDARELDEITERVEKNTLIALVNRAGGALSFDLSEIENDQIGDSVLVMSLEDDGRVSFRTERKH